MNSTQIADYDKWQFTAIVPKDHAVSHDVYARGSGKIVVIIQELPGIGQETLALADRFVDRGYRVILPHLFGPLGKTNSITNTVRVLCLRKEFRIFSANESSPIVSWLKALCRKVKDEDNVVGVAVIGMCLTGNFAISLMADEAVLAGFASQPSLPIFKQSSLHLSNQEVKIIKNRLAEIGPMLCGRFAKDIFCRTSKFEEYRKVFNQGENELIKLHTLPGRGHSILTLDFVDDKNHPTFRMLEEIMSYFDEALRE